MILIINDLGGRYPYRYCNDGKFRDFASYGNMKGCVKVYTSLGQAKRVAQRINAQSINWTTQVMQLPDGMEIDMSGRIIERVPTGNGYENIVEHKASEFVI